MSDNPEIMFRDLAELDQRELTSMIIVDYRNLGVEFVLPNIFSEDDCHSVLHNRIQRIQDLPDLQPENIETKILDGIHRLNPDRQPQEDIDKLFNVRKSGLLKGDRLNELGLSKIEQVLLVRGVSIAATSRRDEAMRAGNEPSTTQQKLEKSAQYFINHMRTNLVHVPANGGELEHNKFLSAYMAAYVAEIVHRELRTQNQYRTNSITGAMRLPIKFGAVLSGDSETRLSIFADGIVKNERETDGSVFEKKHPSEIDESRIKELRKLQFTYGDESSRFTYYETTSAFRKGKNRSAGGAVSLITGERQQQPQERYTVLVIDQPDETGRVKRHAVAENKQVGNACYGLRQEVLDEWEKILGVRLTWQDIFYPKRLIARQLGGRVFTHAKNSNVNQRLLEYLNQDADSVVYETFSRLFDTEAELFDDAMNPTEKNIMPSYFIESIKQSPVLKELWPVIRKHGYATTYRILRNIEETERLKPSSERAQPERKVRLIDRALEIFTAAANADAVNDGK